MLFAVKRQKRRCRAAELNFRGLLFLCARANATAPPLKPLRSIIMSKTLLRREFTARRDALDPLLAAVNDAALCRAVSSLPEFISAPVVLLYSPIGSEVDVMPLFFAARELGKEVGFPRADKSAHEMVFHSVSSPDGLMPGAYGILEPAGNSPVDTRGALCVLPGLAFDRDGYRLGYGGGYYDRFLSSTPGVTSVAPVRDGFLLSDPLPRGEFDRRADIIVTSKEVLIFNRG